MIVVIQCAATKKRTAGYLMTPGGKRVRFVANPEIAPRDDNAVYARPDDLAHGDVSWRQLLREYNQTRPDNPFRLLEAANLYDKPVYSRLVKKFGPRKVYILSAGWGLLAAHFLTPCYDITFSKSAERYKRRSEEDGYEDFPLPAGLKDDIVFFGGRDYVPLFTRLTSAVETTKTIFYKAKNTPQAPGYILRRFNTNRRTNWHYECANAFLNGELRGFRDLA